MSRLDRRAISIAYIALLFSLVLVIILVFYSTSFPQSTSCRPVRSLHGSPALPGEIFWMTQTVCNPGLMAMRTRRPLLILLPQ
jgi:hypothetical protein